MIKRRIGEQTAKLTSLPEAGVMNMPQLTLLGDSDLCAELYGKLAQYSDVLIRLATPYYTVTVYGEGLRIVCINSDILRIHGKIHKICLE